MTAVHLDSSYNLTYTKDDKTYLLLLNDRPITFWPGNIFDNNDVLLTLKYEKNNADQFFTNDYIHNLVENKQNLVVYDEENGYWKDKLDNPLLVKNLISGKFQKVYNLVVSYKKQTSLMKFTEGVFYSTQLTNFNYLKLDKETTYTDEDTKNKYLAYTVKTTSILTNIIQLSDTRLSNVNDEITKNRDNNNLSHLVIEEGTDVIVPKYYVEADLIEESEEETTTEDYYNSVDTEGYITPEEFYSSMENISSEIQDSEYISETISDTENTPIWWWCNTLMNWCTFKLDSDNIAKVFVWNGKNNWDNLDKIMEIILDPQKTVDEKKQIIRNTYNYSSQILDRIWGLEQLLLSAVNKPIVLINGNGESKYGTYLQKTILLPFDTKYSAYDSKTFQTLRKNSMYFGQSNISTKNDITGYVRHTSEIGCPMVYRTPAHELALIYYFYNPLEPNSSETYSYNSVTKEAIQFYNKILKAYFGDGSNKTIEQDWKHHSSSYIGTPSDLSIDQDLQYSGDKLNTYIEDTDSAKIKFEVNTVITETDPNTEEPSYLERWR